MILLSIMTSMACSPQPHPAPPLVDQETAAPRIDPAAWGTDHVGQDHPEYLVGGECLFCHRDDVGSKWAVNQHNRTVRLAEPDDPVVRALAENPNTAPFAQTVQFLIGHHRHVRFLKPSQAYGKLDLLAPVASQPASVGTTDAPAKLLQTDNPQWDTETFAQSCAGCHTTAVNTQRRQFSAIALDCYTCHGNTPVEHANEPTLMHFAKNRKDDPRVVTSICAQCHIRTGKSKSTGLPYPNTFVPGDNLFKDFQIDFALADSPEVNPSDRHVLANVRDVTLLGKHDMTCLTCHEIHRDSTRRHRRQDVTAYCFICHDQSDVKKPIPPYEVHSDLCGY
jgi:cytochrome c553